MLKPILMDAKETNLLTLDQLSSSRALVGSALSRDDLLFCHEILEKVFQKLVLPPTSELKSIHPLADDLLTIDSTKLRGLYTLAVELDLAMQIPNHEIVLGRLRSSELDAFLGARGEIKAGAWAKELKSLEYVIPKSKKGKTADLKGETPWGPVRIEVKSESQFDFSTGLGMFRGWIRSEIVRLFIKDDLKIEVSFGSYWIDAIGAACRINSNLTNASWAFHSVIISLTTLAIQKMYDQWFKVAADGSGKINPDIDCVISKRTNLEEPVVINLPMSSQMATLGRIIRDVSSPENILQGGMEDFVFFSYVKEKPDEIATRTMLGNLFLQAPDLDPHCLGVAISDSITEELLIVDNDRPILSKNKLEERWEKLHSCFKKPTKLKHK